MIRQAVILAGGRGTRLQERLNGLPKPLVEIGGVPLLEHQVLLAKRHGVDRILLLVRHEAQRIIEFCAARQHWGIAVDCIDDGEPMGTAGTVLRAFDRLEDTFLVLYGDTMLEVDLTRFCRFHCALAKAAATLFLHPNDHPHDSDLVEIDDDARITAFHPYPHDPSRVYPNLVKAALYVVRKSALSPWRSCARLDFAQDLFPAMLCRGARLYGYSSPEYIKDCGTPGRLDRVSRDLASGKIARCSLTAPQPAIFLDRDGTINSHVGYVSRATQLSLIPGAGEAIKRLNDSDYRTVVVTNQSVIARGDCSFEELRRIHWTMEKGLSDSGAYLDRILVCPHHPDRGFAGEVTALKIQCECRKPSTGLIDRAVMELNIARDRSWMVGDSTSDILAANRAGLKSILVETGRAGLDRGYDVAADFVVEDLLAAVAFIIDEYPRLAELCDEIAATVRPRDIVYIAGMSRSGKTTLASALRLTLRERGLPAVVISADRWLLNARNREPGAFGQYELPPMTEVIRTIAARSDAMDISLPAYDRLARRRADEAENVTVEREDVVIVEGTVALQIAAALQHESHRYFVESDEALRHARVIREYRLRGCSDAEAESIYASRQLDETPAVAATAALAGRRILLPLAEAGSRIVQTPF